MAGKPQTRARREAEAQARYKRRDDRADLVTRREAVEMADRLGAAAAAKRYGVQPGTIRQWRRRLGAEAAAAAAENTPGEAVSGPPAATGASAAAADPLAVAEERAARAWEVASEALEQAAEQIVKGDAKSARDLAVVMGVLTDKAGRIEAGVTKLRESGARIRESQDRALQSAVVAWTSAVGWPMGDHGRALLGSILRSAREDGVVRVDAELAVPARDEVREHWRALIAREAAVERVQAGDVDPDDDDEKGEQDEPTDEQPVDEAPLAEEPKPVRAPERVTGGMSRAEIDKIAKDIGSRHQDVRERGFVAGRRQSGFGRFDGGRQW